jgi:hypothetical protein
MAHAARFAPATPALSGRRLRVLARKVSGYAQSVTANAEWRRGQAPKIAALAAVPGAGACPRDRTGLDLKMELL